MGKSGDLECHERLEYHKSAVIAGNNFLKNFHDPTLEVRNQVDASHLSQVQENRKRLIPIVKIILFLGRQNIAFRGHRDDGPILTDPLPIKNEGNFRALVRFRVDAGDKELKSHLENSTSKATYVSKTTQEQLIECSRLVILDKILKRVTKSSF